MVLFLHERGLLPAEEKVSYFLQHLPRNTASLSAARPTSMYTTYSSVGTPPRSRFTTFRFLPRKPPRPMRPQLMPPMRTRMRTILSMGHLPQLPPGLQQLPESVGGGVGVAIGKGRGRKYGE